MSNVETEISPGGAEAVAEIVDNITSNVTSIPTTPEGQALAYSSLVIMALVPIFVGSFRSINAIEQQKVNMVEYHVLLSIVNCFFISEK